MHINFVNYNVSKDAHQCAPFGNAACRSKALLILDLAQITRNGSYIMTGSSKNVVAS